MSKQASKEGRKGKRERNLKVKWKPSSIHYGINLSNVSAFLKSFSLLIDKEPGLKPLTPPLLSNKPQHPRHRNKGEIFARHELGNFFIKEGMETQIAHLQMFPAWNCDFFWLRWNWKDKGEKMLEHGCTVCMHFSIGTCSICNMS